MVSYLETQRRERKRFNVVLRSILIGRIKFYAWNSGIPSASSLLYSAKRAPSPSHIRYLADRPECTKLLHGFLIFNNKPASAQCSRPYRCGSGARGPLHRIQSPPSQICISLRTVPDGNLNLMTVCSLCPHRHRSAWALSHCLEF